MNSRVAEEVTKHLSSCERCRTLVAERQDPGDPERGARAAAAPKAMVKVQCSTCNARYGIPEERLKGKVLKIRCKECKTIIEVRPPAATKSVLERGTKQWFVVVKRERTGPFTEQEIREMFARGEVKPRSYCWRRGFTQWERLNNVPAFEDLLAAADAAVEPQQDGPSTLPLPGLISSEQQRPDQTEVGRPAAMMEGVGEREDSELDLPTDPDANRQPYGVHLTGSYAEKPDSGDAAFQQQLNAEHEQGENFQENELTDSDDVETSAPNEESSRADEAFATEAELALASTVVSAGPLLGSEDVPATEEAAQSADEATEGDSADMWSTESEESATLSDDVMAGGGDDGLAGGGDDSLADGEYDKHMTGQRHENSVLFSLGHLQNIAMTGKPKPASSAKSADSADEEKSTGLTGLFDVRSVASPASPIMLPADPPEAKGMKMSTLVGMMVLGIILGVGLLAGGVYLLKPEIIQALMGQGGSSSSGPSAQAALNKKPSVRGQGTMAAAPVKKPQTAPLALDHEGAGAVAKGEGKPDGGAAKVDAAAVASANDALRGEKKDEPKPAAVAVKAPPRKKSKRVKRRARRTTSKAKPASKEGGTESAGDEGAGDPAKGQGADPEGTKNPAGDKGKGDPEENELDKLIDGATAKKPAPATPKEGSEGESKPEKTAPDPGETAAPKTLDQHQIAVGMRRAQAAVNACGERFMRDGEVKVKVTIDGASKRVTKGAIIGEFAGTPLGTCVLSAVKTSARFPKFSDPPLTLQYPFFIRTKNEAE